MKQHKAGQIYYVNGKMYRFKKSLNCKGCVLDTIFSCPNIMDRRNINKEPLDCIYNGLILVEP